MEFILNGLCHGGIKLDPTLRISLCGVRLGVVLPAGHGVSVEGVRGAAGNYLVRWV